MKKLYIVTPTYNEKGNIARLVDAVFTVAPKLKGVELHLFVADDYSPDGTGDVVKKLQKKYKRLHLFQGKKSGLGAAYARAFNHVLKNTDADFIGMMDADLSHNPEKLVEMVAALKAGNDVVLGSRHMPGGSVSSDWPWYRKINTWGANIIARYVGGISNVHDMTTGYRLITRKALGAIDYTSQTATGYVFQISMVNEFQTKGFSIFEVPIHFQNRDYGNSKIGIKDITQFMWVALNLRNNSLQKRVLRFTLAAAPWFIVYGVAMALVGVAGSVYLHLMLFAAIFLWGYLKSRVTISTHRVSS